MRFSKKVSLSRWFHINVSVALSFLIATIFASQVTFLYFQILQSNRTQSAQRTEAAEMLQSSLVSKNRPLAELLLNLLSTNHKATSVALCNKGRTQLVINGDHTYCENLQKREILTHTVTEPIPGMANLYLKMTVPWVAGGLLLHLGVLSLVFLALFVLLIFNLKRRLKADILVPLEQGVLQDVPTMILEIDDVMKKRREYDELKRKEMFSELAKQVAHDIRSPLSALRILSQSLRDLPEEKRNLLTKITSRVEEIADDLMLKSRLAISGKPLANVTELLNGAVEEAKLRLDSKQIAISTDVGPNLLASIPASDFSRVIANLLNNSREGIDGSGVIAITAHKDNREILIHIEDTGCGISEEMKNQIGKKGITTKPNGNGLGLAHAFEQLKHWGGSLAFQSRQPRGTRVEMRVPLVN